ncbi:hypothetical protein ABT070_30745, partial [Streptomyces sp. NPDC002884]
MGAVAGLLDTTETGRRRSGGAGAPSARAHAAPIAHRPDVHPTACYHPAIVRSVTSTKKQTQVRLEEDVLAAGKAAAA